MNQKNEEERLLKEAAQIDLTTGGQMENNHVLMPQGMPTAVVKNGSENSFGAGMVDESMLTDNEKQLVNKYSLEIDLEDVNAIVNYGSAAQKNISDFSRSVLQKVRTLDLGEMGQSLKDLKSAMDLTVEPHKRGLAGVFQKGKHKINDIKANYSKVETNVDKIEKDLRSHLEVLTDDIAMFQNMYIMNLQYYRQLTIYIIAGKKALAKERAGKLEQLRVKAEQTQKQEDAQAYKDYADLCSRFEKKLNDMELTRMISIQTAPQVRMIQNNDREMLDKIQSSLVNTIPLWRNQLVLTLGIEHSRRAIDAQSAISEKTNELLRQNADTLKMATVDAAREAERPIVDIATLEKCNMDLITSINEIVKIHEEGSQKRAQAHEQMLKLEEELQQVMVQKK